MYLMLASVHEVQALYATGSCVCVMLSCHVFSRRWNEQSFCCRCWVQQMVICSLMRLSMKIRILLRMLLLQTLKLLKRLSMTWIHCVVMMWAHFCVCVIYYVYSSESGSQMSVRTFYVRPSTKHFFDFNEIWHIGRGRWVMHDGMQYDPIQGQVQLHEPLKVGNPSMFKSYLLRHYSGSWQLTTDS